MSLDGIKWKRSALTFKGEAVMYILDFGFCLQENTSHINYKMNYSNDVVQKIAI